MIQLIQEIIFARFGRDTAVLFFFIFVHRQAFCGMLFPADEILPDRFSFRTRE